MTAIKHATAILPPPPPPPPRISRVLFALFIFIFIIFALYMVQDRIRPPPSILILSVGILFHSVSSTALSMDLNACARPAGAQVAHIYIFLFNFRHILSFRTFLDMSGVLRHYALLNFMHCWDLRRPWICTLRCFSIKWRGIYICYYFNVGGIIFGRVDMMTKVS